MITLLAWLADVTPTPSPSPALNEDLVTPGIVISRPQVVTKSFPGFFEALRSLGARVEHVEKGAR